jgi:hypothetical protein
MPDSSAPASSSSPHHSKRATSPSSTNCSGPPRCIGVEAASAGARDAMWSEPIGSVSHPETATVTGGATARCPPPASTAPASTAPVRWNPAGHTPPVPGSSTSQGLETPPVPRTRLQKGIRQPKKYTDGTIRYSFLCSTGEPQNHHEALDNPNWRHAMDEEYDALMKNRTCHLVPELSGNKKYH